MSEAKAIIHDLLMSADAAWEEQRLGHDWADACQRAQAFVNGWHPYASHAVVLAPPEDEKENKS